MSWLDSIATSIIAEFNDDRFIEQFPLEANYWKTSGYTIEVVLIGICIVLDV